MGTGCEVQHRKKEVTFFINIYQKANGSEGHAPHKTKESADHYFRESKKAAWYGYRINLMVK